MANREPRTYTNTSLDRSLRLLRLFDGTTTSLTLSEIARGLDMTPGGAYPLVQTLVRHRFLARDDMTKRYRLGLGILERANHVLASLDVRDAARPVLREVAQRLRANAHLAIPYGLEVLYVDREEASLGVVFRSIIGRKAPLHCTALGKVFLAADEQLLDSLLESELPSFTENTICSATELRKEIRRTRAAGYATDDQEFHLGQVCFAAPVQDFRGHVAAAVSVSVPHVRLESEPEEGFPEAIVEAAAKISSSLGHPPA